MIEYNYDENGKLLPPEQRGRLRQSQQPQSNYPQSNYPLSQAPGSGQSPQPSNYPIPDQNYQQQPQGYPTQPQQNIQLPGYPSPGQPPVILVGNNTSQCRFCGSPVPPITTRVTSGLGWALFGIMLVSCIGTPFCWLGLLMKREKRVCSTCRARLL